MASYPKRSIRTPSFTEVLCTSGEQETLRASAAVPPKQQRLVFGPSPPAVSVGGGQDPLLAELQTTQAIVFQDSRALGRLVKPRVLVDSLGELSSGSFVSLTYDYWQPVSVNRKHGPVQHLRIPLDSRYCSTSVFSLSAILTGPGGPVALPSHEWSGRETAAAVNQQQQKLDYIRRQQKLFTEGEGKDSPNRHLLARSDAEYTIDIGPEWKTSLSLTFNTAAELPWLQRVNLKLLVVPKALVDDNGGPGGDTSAEVTVSSSSVGASGLIEMASASAQPVPQGHTGRQQAGGGGQPADDTLPQAQHTCQADTPSCMSVGSAADGDVGCVGVVAILEGTSKPESGFSSPAIALANYGGAAGSCRRGAAQSTRSAGGGGEAPGSSDSEDEGQSDSSQGRGSAGNGGGGTGGGAGSGGDREDPGRERGRGQESESASSKSSRKPKRESEAATTDAAAVEANGLESQQVVVTPGSSPAVPSSSHSQSDRDATASLQEASSRTTTMDTVDASSDAADEHQLGVAESKPTVKLIPNGGGPTCGDDGVITRTSAVAAEQREARSFPTIAAQVAQPCGSFRGGENNAASRGGVALAAAEARVCVSGCCGGRGSASGADEESSAAPESAPSAACPNAAAAKSFTAVAAQEGSGGDAGLPSGRRKSDGAPSGVLAASEGTGHATAQSLVSSVDTASAPAAASSAVDSGCRGTPPSSSPQATSTTLVASTQQPLPPQQQQPRPYPNGATLPQPYAKGTSQGSDMQQVLLQQQQQAASAGAMSHMPHLPPHALHHGAHGHAMQNGKVRNGELLSDPALLAQQLLPALAGFVPGQPGGSGAAAQQQQQQAAAQPHTAFAANGVDAALLQQLLLAQSNGAALQLQQQAGIPLHGQHVQSAVSMYNLLLQQQAQQQQHVQAQHHHQQQAQVQFMQMFQPQYQQYVAQQQAQQQHHHQQQQQQQQVFLQSLAQAEAQYAVPAAVVDVAAFAAPLPTAVTAMQSAAAAAQPGAVESFVLPSDASAQPPPQQQQQGATPASAQPLSPAPIVTPTPAVSQMQTAGPHSVDSAGQSPWDTGSSASSVRSEPTTAMAAPLVERPMGPQHRVQSQGNMLATAQGGAGGSGASRDGSGGRPSSSYRGRTSFSGTGGPPGPSGGGGASSSSSAGGPAPPPVMMQGGGTYGPRPYGGPTGGSRHGGSGGHGYSRGGRYDGGSAESSRPSSRGPHPHGGGHMRHPHPADPVPPPEALPLPDHPKGSCDLDRFISQIEPFIAIDPAKPPQQALQELRLRDLWNFYFEPSLYGREVFTLGGHRGASNSYFVPYLSAIQIFTRALPTDVGGTNRLYVSEDNQGWPKHMHLKFEYFEQELPFNRLPLYDQIELLSSTMAAAAAAKAANTGAGPSGASAGRAPVPAAAAGAAAPTGALAAPPAVAAVPVPAASSARATGKEEALAEALASTVAPAPNAGAPSAPSGAVGEEVDAAAVTPADDPSGGAKASGAGAEAAQNAGGKGEQPTSHGAQAAAACGGPEEGAVADVAATPATASGAAASLGPSPAAVQPAQGGSPPAPAAEGDAVASNTGGSSGGGGTGLLYDMRLQDVHPASWFAVAWYPVYRIPDAPLYARFLTFHSFAPLVESMRNVHERLAMGQVAPYYILSLPVVGLNWYNMQGERWMEPLEEARPHAGPAAPPLIAASAPAAAANSPRGPPHHRGGGGGGRVSGTDVWYQHLLQNYQSTADRLARGLGLKVLGQHGAEEVRLRVPDYEFFRARS